ncbi:hypothetical protein [Pseudomonas mohnii]
MLEQFSLVLTKATPVKVGDRFGSLNVMAVGQVAGTYRYFAVCQCDCGSPAKKIRFDHLTSGKSESCGCQRLLSVTTHGMSSSEHYGRWRHMMSRCYDEKSAAYHNYGGRGIKVFEGWHDVEKYIADLPAGYFKGAEIDRIDNDGDYCPGNIKWSTPSQNSDNRRSGKMLTHDGKTQSQRRWAQELGLTDQIIHDRIDGLGWTIERALTTPPIASKERMRIALEARWAGHDTKGKPEPKTSRRRLMVEHEGAMVTMAELSAITGVTVKNLRRRIVELGWPVDRAIQK